MKEFKKYTWVYCNDPTRLLCVQFMHYDTIQKKYVLHGLRTTWTFGGNINFQALFDNGKLIKIYVGYNIWNPQKIEDLNVLIVNEDIDNTDFGKSLRQSADEYLIRYTKGILRIAGS
jgi:hypothetical protein